MAKGKNDATTGRRPSSSSTSSRGSKPYDANNSFVKKVATKVTDLIPQRSWISKWFNTSQDNGDISNEINNTGDIEVDDEVQQPPPSKRPRILMDVTHPPGTFAIQPRNKEQYSIRNDTTEDFLQPVIASSSGINHLVSSTPAVQMEHRNSSTQRSELNTLVSSQNNGLSNGADDNSESSESTSGCSSLIPQTNRQEAPSNLSYNASFNSRKKFINEKLNFTSHLQSSHLSFLDNASRDSLSNRRPSFNVSLVTNSLNKSSSTLASPFYEGNITYGGANAVNLYNRSGSILNETHKYQLKVPTRPSVQVKSSTAASGDSSGMSQTAKRILEALEHFSSPISDAKKIPLKGEKMTPISNKKRSREDETVTPRVGLRHLTRELTVPTVPEMLKLRRRQKLQNTTIAARKIISAQSEPPPAIQEYRLRSEIDDDDRKSRGKVSGKNYIDQEERVAPVNLPNIVLPIPSNFNFDFLPIATNSVKPATQNNEQFKFASPIKVTYTTQNLKSINNFTFSNPISAKANDTSEVNFSCQSAKSSEMEFNVPISNTPSLSMPNFIWKESSTAPRMKEKAKDKSSSVKIAEVLKSENIMDILNQPINLESRDSDQKNNDIDVMKTGLNKPLTANIKPDTWECSECLIRNNNNVTNCIACKASKKVNTDNKVLQPSVNNTSNTTNKDGFGLQFKSPVNQWECDSCWVKNKSTDDKCVACSASKPIKKSEMKPLSKFTSNTESKNIDIMSQFKPAVGSWECPGCMLRNESNVITCPCCNASKPGSSKVSTKRKLTTENDVKESENTTNSIISFSQPVKSDLTEKFKPKQDTWECPSCMVRNSVTASKCVCCETVQPGTSNNSASSAVESKANDIIKTDSNKSSAGGSTLKFNFEMPANAGNFKFGIDKADTNSNSEKISTNGFKFGETQSSEAINVSFGIPKEKEETNVTKNKNIDSNNTVAKNTTEKDNLLQQNDKDNKKTPVFSFGLQQNKSTVPNQSELSKSNSVLENTFTFKPTQVTSNKNESITNNQNAGGSNNSVTFTTSTCSETAQNQTLVSQKDVSNKSLPNFAFGVPSTTSINASSSSTLTTSNSTGFNQSAFAFTNSKLATSTNVTTTFEQASKTIPAITSTAVFTFGSSSTNIPTTSLASNKTTPDFGSIMGGIYKNSDANPSLFGNKDAKPAFGSTENKTSTFSSIDNKTPTFSTIGNKSSLFNTTDSKTQSFGTTSDNKMPIFGLTDNKIPSFGSTENKTTAFGASDTKISGFVNTESTNTSTLFNAPTQTPAAPAFSVPTANTSSMFGTTNTPTFGANPSSTFGNNSTPKIFSPPKPNDNNVANPNPNANLFAFGSSSSQSAPQNSQQGSGFGFNSNNNSNNTTQKSLFVFNNTSSNTPQETSNVFGGNAFNTPVAANTGSFPFNAPKPETPATFGQSATTSMFGATQNATQPAPSFAASSAPNTGYNFGPVVANTSTGGFNFGGMQSQPAPLSGFNFNPPSSAPCNFNFTGGTSIASFNAPQPRIIKKAMRRRNRETQH